MAHNNGFGAEGSRPSSLEIFKISATELKDLFIREGDKLAENHALQRLYSYGGIEGVLKMIQTEAGSGIMGDNADIHRRQIKYARNEKPRPQRVRFFDSVKEAINDRILLMVAIFAVISIIPGMIIHPATGWVEGTFILVALFVQVLICAYNDYQQDSKFIELQSLNRDENIPVIRGKHGSMQTVSIWDIVVGDIISLAPGDKVPADCLVVSSANLRVKQPDLTETESGVTKIDWTETHKTVSEPFLFADSYVTGGTCRAVVVCVGEHSSRGIEDTKFDVQQDETELTRKLDNIGGTLKFVGLITCFIILGVSMAVLFIQTAADDQIGGPIFMDKLVANIVISLIMLIVAIPEGLPMTVMLSLAHSVLLMNKYDNLLVRDINSVEQVGLITDLCLGKTGTMTTEEMEVVNFYTQNIFVLNSRKNTLMQCELDNSIIEKIIESIVYNSQAHIEMTDNSFYLPIGNGTEVSLIKWLQDAEIPVHEVMAQKEGRVLAQVPFDSKMKRSIIAVQHPYLSDTVRIYVKGAPEIVLQNCTSHYQSGANPTGIEKKAEKVPLYPQDKETILQAIMHAKMTSQALRAMAFSYQDMSIGQFQHIMNQMQGDVDSAEEIAALERDMTFLAMVALKDPVRPSIKAVVTEARESMINLRLISGDNLQTTCAVAYDVGIMTQQEYQLLNSLDNPARVAMDASEFRDLVGDVIRQVEEKLPGQEGGETTYSYHLSDQGQHEFNQIIVSLKVIGRAEPEDKLRLVAGLRGMTEDVEQEIGNEEDEDEEQQTEIIKIPSRRVAVVGEGINDIDAFMAANVSFAVQDGSSLARNNASMVLMTNDFDSCMRAVMWGRNIYMNVQRFLQFQITCNLSVLVVVIVSYVTLTQSALNPVQLIYINLIMDIFGALALAATRPQTDLAEFHAGQGNIMTPYMYRQIFGVTIYMITIMMIVMYTGKSMFELDYDLATQIIDEDDPLAKQKMMHFTLIWNTFIFLQVFNLVNCRDVGGVKMHGCGGLFRNVLTWLIILMIVAVQVVACKTFLGRILFEASIVDTRHFFITVVCGSSVMLASMLLKLIPNRWIEGKMPSLDESKSIGGSSKLMAVYKKQSEAKAYTRKNADMTPVGQEDTDDDQQQYEDDDNYQNADNRRY